MDVKSEYKRLRALGFGAAQSLRGAKINVAWEDAEEEGLVKLELRPDDERFDDSFIDTWHDVSPERRERARKELWEKIEDQGVWGVCAYARGPCGDLHVIDSCWGFVGDEWKDSGYDHDLKQSALEML